MKMLRSVGAIGILRASDLFYSMLLVMLFLHRFESEQVGQFILIQTIATLLRLCTDLELDIFGIKKIRSRPKSVANIFANIFLLRLALSVLFVAVFLLIPLFFNAGQSWLFWLVCSAYIWKGLAYPLFYFQAMENYNFIILANFVEKGFAGAVIVVKAFYFSSSFSMSFSLAVIFIFQVISGLVVNYFIFRHIRPAKSNIRLKVMQLCFYQGLLLFYSRAMMLYPKLGKIFLGAALGPTPLLVVDIAERVSNFCRLPLNVIHQALFARSVSNRSHVFPIVISGIAGSFILAGLSLALDQGMQSFFNITSTSLVYAVALSIAGIAFSFLNVFVGNHIIYILYKAKPIVISSSLSFASFVASIIVFYMTNNLNEITFVFSLLIPQILKSAYYIIFLAANGNLKKNVG